ncbi:MAG: hypothetical protein CM1200mP9_03910 [Gammaproteobacteria bacterium]|nr:MAG: hypothetical protein CM1200mP9_03910 [Gammaproteobacteria bacterium]
MYVQEANWEIVCGTEIDYVTEGLNSSLKFNNPMPTRFVAAEGSFSIRGTWARSLTKNRWKRGWSDRDTRPFQKGAFVTLTQALGGTYTVVHEGNMARIDGEDADALGFEPEVMSFDDPQRWQTLRKSGLGSITKRSRS